MTSHPSRVRPSRILLAVMAVVMGYVGVTSYTRRARMDRLVLPAGFSISTYAEVGNARQMAFGSAGTLFVGSMSAGRVLAVVDLDGDHVADEKHVIAEGLRMPSGIAFRDGALYVAARHEILRFDGVEDRLADPPEPSVIRDDLPTEDHHGWKYLDFGPDGWLYVPVGAPCNVCSETDPRFASILRMRPDGTDLEVFAHGVRNSVGFDFDPETGDLWFTDNGRDGMGDDLPDDELNHAPVGGLHFGFPFCHAGSVPDPGLAHLGSCDRATPPAQRLGAHVAAVGMTFYTGESFPAHYRNNVFIALHGSWDRSSKTGYQVARVVINDNQVASYEPFVTGWLRREVDWGRPADVIVAPDGTLLISDDRAGRVYRVAFVGR